MDEFDEFDIEEEPRWAGLEDYIDVDSIEDISQTLVSCVSLARSRRPAGSWVAVKSASTNPKYTKQPHDIAKELRILQSNSHHNVIDILGTVHDGPSDTLHFWMPFIPTSLSDILNNPRFSPFHPPGDTDASSLSTDVFLTLMKSLLRQLFSALAFIHERGISHRDVKPSNILITPSGLVKLIDFGVAWTVQPDDRDLWPETDRHMCFDVATGPYRAPELLFGTRDYDAQAVDMWSTGVVLTECFTTLRLRRCFEDEDDYFGHPSHADDEDDDTEAESTTTKPPFMVPRGLSPGQPDTEWERESLYDASRGQIGLAWSIFKVHGTPTEALWPDFKRLPDAQKVNFVQVPPADLRKLLPNLPAAETQPEHDDCFDLVSKLLVYPPGSRFQARDAVMHSMFTRGLPVMLPDELEPHRKSVGDPTGGRSLGEILACYMESSAS